MQDSIGNILKGSGELLYGIDEWMRSCFSDLENNPQLFREGYEGKNIFVPIFQENLTRSSLQWQTSPQLSDHGKFAIAAILTLYDPSWVPGAQPYLAWQITASNRAGNINLPIYAYSAYPHFDPAQWCFAAASSENVGIYHYKDRTNSGYSIRTCVIYQEPASLESKRSEFFGQFSAMVRAMTYDQFQVNTYAEKLSPWLMEIERIPVPKT